MSNDEVSLAQLFDACASGNRSASQVIGSAIEQTVAFKSVCAAAAVALPQNHWRAASEEVARQLRALLDVPVPRVLMTAWRFRKEMMAYCDRDRYPADRSVVVQLAEHAITWSQEPKIHIHLDTTPIGPALQFEIDLKLNLDLAVITIRGGRVLSLDAGTATLDGVVRLEGEDIIERRTQAVPIPGRIGFGEGLSLCGTEGHSYSPGSTKSHRAVRS